MGRPKGVSPVVQAEADALIDFIAAKQGPPHRLFFDDLMYEIRSEPTLAALTVCQVDHRLKVIKDSRAMVWDMPFTHHPVWGYRFADTLVEVREYAQRRVIAGRTTTGRLLNGTLTPAKSKFGTRAAREAEKSAMRLVQDLEDMVVDLQP